uniref:Protein Nef n=1 Tax=Human immunodeficiency virus 2 TaxID=11709 RepID=E2D736_9HIV2|nr:nef protein [Human immunodeficiency virus 2]
MGASGSKKPSRPPRGLQERLLRARAGTCGGYWDELGEEYLQSQEGSGRGQRSPSCEGQKYQQGEFMNTPWRTPATEREGNAHKQQNMDDVNSDDDDLIGVPVTPRVPLRAMTRRMAIDMVTFNKNKGGLEGMFYSERRHRILDIYLEKEEGIIPDWQNYMAWPGTRYPMFFGWLWKLVPVDVPQEGEDIETHCLVHPAQVSRFDDPHGETLVWRFDPTLAHDYVAFRKYPEEFGHKSGLPEEEWKAKLKARGIPFS